MELQRYLELLKQKKWVFLSAFVVVFGIFATWTFFAVRVYDATAKVMLVESSNTLAALTASLGVSSQTGQSTTSSSSTSKNYDTEIALMTLRPLLDSLINELELKSHNGKLVTSKQLVKSAMLAKVFARPYLEVSELEDSDILTITSYSPDAAQAARMSNRLAEMFIKDRVRSIQKEYGAVREFLEQNIKNVERRYKNALTTKANSMVAEKTIDLATESKALIDFNSTMEKKLDDLLTEAAGMAVEKKESHPDVVAMNKKIDTIKGIIQQKVLTDMAAIPQKSARLSVDDTTLNVQQDLYKKLLDYLMKLNVAESMTLSKNTMVEAASPSEDVNFPKKPLMLVLGLIFGFCGAAAAVFFADQLDTTIKGQEDLRDGPHPLLGQVPRSPGRPLLLTGDSRTPFQESYWQILWNLHRGEALSSPAKLLVSSSGPREGRTTTVINLGTLYARQGKTVLLIDADLRHAGLSRALALPEAEGMTDALSNGMPLDRLFRSTDVSGMSVLQRGTVDAHPSMLASEKMAGLVQSLAQRFDILIFDTAPLLIRSDALVLSRIADAMVLVARNNRTTRPALAQVETLLRQVEIFPRGIILNGTPPGEYYTFMPMLVSLQDRGRSAAAYVLDRIRGRKN